MSCEAIYNLFFSVMEKLDTTDGQLFIKVSISGSNSSYSESATAYISLHSVRPANYEILIEPRQLCANP